MSKKSASKMKLGGTTTAPGPHDIDGYSCVVGDCVHFTPAKTAPFETVWKRAGFEAKLSSIQSLLKRHPGARGVLFFIPMDGGTLIVSPMVDAAIDHSESFARAIATGGDGFFCVEPGEYLRGAEVLLYAFAGMTGEQRSKNSQVLRYAFVLHCMDFGFDADKVLRLRSAPKEFREQILAAMAETERQALSADTEVDQISDGAVLASTTPSL